MIQEAEYWRQQGVVLTEDLEKFFEAEHKRRRNQNRQDERNQLSFVGRYAPEQGWDGSDPVFEAAICDTDRKKLWDAISRLSVRDHDLILKYYFKENTVAELGEQYGVSKMAVSKRLKVVLRSMRVLMEA